MKSEDIIDVVMDCKATKKKKKRWKLIIFIEEMLFLVN